MMTKPSRKPTSKNLANEIALVEDCPIMAAMSVIGGRWKLPLLWALRGGPKTVTELRKVLQGSEKMLSQHASELVRDGFLTRRAKQNVRGTVEYALSERGKQFIPVLQTIYDWSKEQSLHQTVSSRLQRIEEQSRTARLCAPQKR